jgi:predicted HTH transcriptional regulator
MRPTPPVQITFVDHKGFVIAAIAVGKGEAPPYMINGTIYVRHGSSDVQALPDEVVRLVSEYVF